MFNINIPELFELVILTILLIGANIIARPLGGLIYAFLTSILGSVPILGKIYHKINSKVKLVSLLKLPAWAISSSGVLLGLMIHNYFWGELNHQYEFWVLLIITFVSILNILHSVILFESTSFDETLEYLRSSSLYREILRRQAINLDIGDINYDETIDELRPRLIRSNFVDLNLTLFFQLVLSFGVMFYALMHLEIIKLIDKNVVPTLWETISLAFTPLEIINSERVPFEGLGWEIIRSISSFFIFYWVVVHIALATSMIDEGKEKLTPKPKKISWEGIINQETERIIKRNIPVKIIAALLNPVDKEIGNENIILLNTTRNNIFLNGWKIMDTNGNISEFPEITILAGDTLKIKIGNGARFSNKGGTITLLTSENNIIDKVSYTENDAIEGLTFAF